jgi:hypothetical protein
LGFFGRRDTNFNSVFVRHNTTPNPKKKIISRHVHNFSWIGYDFQGRIQNWESENYIEWRLPRNSYFQSRLGTGLRAHSRRGVWCFAQCAMHQRSRSGEALPRGFLRTGRRTLSSQEPFLHRRQFAVQQEDSIQRPRGLACESSRFGFWGRPPFSTRQSRGAACWDSARRSIRAPETCSSSAAASRINRQTSCACSLTTSRIASCERTLASSPFDTNIFTLRTTYQFTKFSFARAIVDYNTLNQRVRAQFLYGWTPNPGTAFYAGYNDDLNYGFNAISSSIIPGIPAQRSYVLHQDVLPVPQEFLSSLRHRTSPRWFILNSFP